MRVVTVHTGHDGCLDREMSLGKGRFCSFMTLFAGCRYRCCQQFIVGCVVGFVAVKAVFPGRFMWVFLAKLVFYEFMAVKTEVISLCQKQAFQLGLMGTVTLGAGPIYEWYMPGFSLFESLVWLMTAAAHQALWF